MGDKMKLLVIGDVHLKFEKAERIASKYNKDYKIIFVGDYFDNFGDTPELNLACADWLKESMSKPNRIHLRGNHDEIYDPRTSSMCSGFSTQKKTAINSTMTLEDWDKLKYFHFENGWWFSHAGLTKYWFQHSMKESITVDHVQKTIDDAIIKQRTGIEDNAIWAADSSRGGDNPVGSILWCDWRNLDMIPSMKQVVGHTPIKKINAITDNTINSSIINVDCSAATNLGEVLEIDELGHTSVIITDYV